MRSRDQIQPQRISVCVYHNLNQTLFHMLTPQEPRAVPTAAVHAGGSEVVSTGSARVRPLGLQTGPGPGTV